MWLMILSCSIRPVSYTHLTGDADSAVKALLSGTLEFNPAVHCSHHDGGHNHGEGHTCGEHMTGAACTNASLHVSFLMIIIIFLLSLP